MQRVISSKQTPLLKIGYPLLWTPMVFYGVYMIFFGATRAPELPTALVFLFLFGSIAFIYWYCIRLKKVSIYGNSLIVSNYLKEIVIPFSEIEKITENVWVNIHPVTIHLKQPTEFGDKIVFMPTFRMFAFWTSHPIVGELRNLIGRANSINRF